MKRPAIGDGAALGSGFEGFTLPLGEREASATALSPLAVSPPGQVR
jgi:hypothetical protein